MEKLLEWLENLDVQTLTDELKKDIIEQIEIVVDEAYEDGYNKAKDDIITHINFYM